MGSGMTTGLPPAKTMYRDSELSVVFNSSTVSVQTEDAARRTGKGDWITGRRERGKLAGNEV